jgi:glycine cleavage system H protein
MQGYAVKYTIYNFDPKLNAMNIPANLLYTNDHEWVKVEGNTGWVGVTDFAQHQLGDIVYVDVATVGDTVETGETFGTIEAVKTVSDMFMPVTALITEFNEALGDTPELINKDTYGEGWIVKVEFPEGTDFSGLLSAEAYTAIVEA